MKISNKEWMALQRALEVQTLGHEGVTYWDFDINPLTRFGLRTLTNLTKKGLLERMIPAPPYFKRWRLTDAGWKVLAEGGSNPFLRA